MNFKAAKTTEDREFAGSYKVTPAGTPCIASLLPSRPGLVAIELEGEKMIVAAAYVKFD